MRKMKLYEEFSNPASGFKERLNKFYQGLEEILKNYEAPDLDIKNKPKEVNNIKDVYDFVKSSPTGLIDWCKKIYDENSQKIDKLSYAVIEPNINEEMCILTLLSLGLMCVVLWLNWPAIKQRLGIYNSRGEGARKGDFLKRNSNPTFKGYGKQKQFSEMNQSELQKELDAALDKGDQSTVKQISKYLK